MCHDLGTIQYLVPERGLALSGEAFWCMLAMRAVGGGSSPPWLAWWLEVGLTRMVVRKSRGGGCDVRCHHCW
jgi:hypothetical protein